MAFKWIKNIILSDEEKKALTGFGSITSAKQLAAVLEEHQGLAAAEFDYNQNISQAYAQNPVVHFATNLKADCTSQPRPELWLNGKLLDNPSPTHKLFGLWKLIQMPNEQMDWADLIKQYSIYMDLAGECFLRRLPDDNALRRGNGKIELLDPSRVKIENNQFIIDQGEGNADIEIDIVDKNGNREVLHRVDWHPTSDRGLSKLTPAWKAIINHNKGLDWNLSLLNNSARLGLVAILKSQTKGSKTLSPEQLTELNKELSKFTGADKAGKSMTLTGDWELTEFGQSQKDLEWNIMLDQMSRMIMWSLQVDPIFLNLKGDSSFSNKSEAYVGLFKFVILPGLNLFKSDFEHWLKEIFPGNWELRFNLDDVAALEPVREKSWERAVNAFKAGLLTLNEAREIVGFGEAEVMPVVVEEEEDVTGDT